MATKEEIEIANKTSRSAGAVGFKAVVPKWIKDNILVEDNHRILDYGAGKSAVHTVALGNKGYDVVAHDFGSNVGYVHHSNALDQEYDILYASNVLNVQSSKKMLVETLQEIYRAVRQGGIFVANYPKSPRKLSLEDKYMRKELNNIFNIVIQDKVNNTKVFICTKG